MAVTPEQQREFLHTKLDADFLYLLEEHGVDLALQYQVGQFYKSIKTFAVFADDRSAVRSAITADFSIRPDSAEDRARIACLVTAWEAARLIREEEAKLKAEAKVLGMQKPLASSDRAAMRLALESVKGYAITEAEEPAAEYLAHKLEQIENGEPTGSYLDEVISRKEAGALQLQTSLDNQGRLRITRQKPKGKLPQSTEELRAKIRLEASTWVMLSAKCKGRVYLRGLELNSFDRYLENLLGDRCYSMQVSSGLPSSTSSGQDRHTLPVPWSVLLQYEFEMRKWAIKEAHKRGEPLGSMLHEATRNTELKELHFTSQVALAKRGQYMTTCHRLTSGSAKARRATKARVERVAARPPPRRMARSRSGRVGSIWSQRLRTAGSFAMLIISSGDVRSKDANVSTLAESKDAKATTQHISMSQTRVPDSLPLHQFHLRIQPMVADLLCECCIFLLDLLERRYGIIFRSSAAEYRSISRCPRWMSAETPAWIFWTKTSLSELCSKSVMDFGMLC